MVVLFVEPPLLRSMSLSDVFLPSFNIKPVLVILNWAGVQHQNASWYSPLVPVV